jgi:hypothetical protein
VSPSIGETASAKGALLGKNAQKKRKEKKEKSFRTPLFRDIPRDITPKNILLQYKIKP